MLFQPIELLCIHGKCNYPYSIEKKIEKMQKRENKKILKVTYKIQGKKEKKPRDSRPTAHLVGCVNFVLEVHLFKYPLVIHALHIIYIIYNWKRRELPFLTNI